MTYGAVVKGTFRARPNRFIAQVDTEEGTQICHVKNTGRCKELLVPGATVYLAEGKNPARKTKYDLVAVEKGSLLINMDSQAPNQVAQEYLPQLLPGLTAWRREQVWGDSRFDLYAEAAGERWFVEVKGVTLEENGVALFPDAPTQRGVKHLHGLMGCLAAGYEAAVCFVIQMAQADFFAPNDRTHPAFGQALREAAQAGVQVLAHACTVTPDSLTLAQAVPVRL